MSLDKPSTSGNVIRKYLEGAGIPHPNQELLNVIAPAIQRDARGGTIRQWKYASAELKPIIEDMRPDFEELEICTNDPEQFELRLQRAKEKFYGLLQKLDEQRNAPKSSEDQGD